MKNKRQYYALDEVGFVGMQEKRTKAQVEKDIKDTVQYIESKRSGRIVQSPLRSSKKAAISKALQQ